ncbi:MAG: iron-sulfur cluster assembly accessory protein, partial [Starkeya sp.]|nr:iron-sulfur cluster assembly accessory protein [Starkeya sp.]
MSAGPSPDIAAPSVGVTASAARRIAEILKGEPPET